MKRRTAGSPNRKRPNPEIKSRSNGFGKQPMRPLFRWVGGKQHLAHRLAEYVPSDLSDRLYREPFFGAGSLFFFIRPRRAVLSDLNSDLIHAYRFVREKPELVARYLSSHARNDSQNYYYDIREEYNYSAHFTAAQSARFLYLNRTCFNGIYRVNLDGDFNVPYGKKENPVFPDGAHVRAASTALRKAKLREGTFEVNLRGTSAGDFIYLDPPYPPLNGTSFFAHYTQDRFPVEEQERLADLVRKLDKTGALVLMSNADLPLIRRLYRGFNRMNLRVPRYVKTGKKKHAVDELIITNYEIQV